MSKPLSLEDIELEVNRQTCYEPESDNLSDVTEVHKPVQVNTSLITPEDLGIDSRHVLSPLAVNYDNYDPFGSDDNIDDPDWTPAPALKNTLVIPLPENESSDSANSFSVQNLSKKRHLFLKRNRRVLPISDSDDDLSGHNDENSVPQENVLPNTSKKNTKARVLGKPYLGFKKIDNKLKPCIEKPERTLKPRCLHTSIVPKSKNSFLCALVSDQERENIHKDFWKLKTWKEKIAFVKTSAVRRGLRRRRRRRESEQRAHKKHSGHDIFINKLDANCTRVRVCRQFFLNTLCIGEDCFRRWTKDDDIVNDHGDRTPPRVPEPGCSSNISLPKYNTVLTRTVKQWLDMLPKVPSHYCRASSKKLYVESTFRSELHMHQVFKEWCAENSYKAASRRTFLKVITQENIAIHHPRKDQCDTCCSFKTGNISQQEYEDHISKKNEARQAKQAAVAKADDKIVVITVDVQSVLLAPKLLASAQYYKMKLQCHNFTVYNVSTKNVTVYFWHEADGSVTANEFTSCLVDYIQTLSPEVKQVIIISDGCGHQNRNRILSSALSDLAQRLGIIIEQLYLEKGHTMMEVDSVHSTIEKYIKPPIYAPSDYVVRMRQARSHNPYEIKCVHYDFFRNFEAMESNLKSIRPGKKKGDPVVVDLRGLKYSPDGSIFYRLRHTDEWTILPYRRSYPRQGLLSPNPLYVRPLQITESKYRHLQELKSVIDKDYHPFYDSLDYNPGT